MGGNGWPSSSSHLHLALPEVDGRHQHAPRTQHATDLGEHDAELGPRDVLHRVGRHHPGDAPGGEGQGAHVALDQSVEGPSGPGHRQHPGGEVQPDGPQPASREVGPDLAGPATQVEDATAGGDEVGGGLEHARSTGRAARSLPKATA